MAIKLDAELDIAPSSTLRAEVANLLRKQILDGDIPSGERLIETEIADQLGVSRMPVREALRMLESEGLINQIPRKGLIVAEYTENDIREYYTIREALEVCAIKIVIDKISKEELEELKMYCRKAEEAHTAGDIEMVCRWTAKFNERIYDSCEMPRLKEQIKTTQKYLRTFRFTGDIWAVPEGTPIFPGEPFLTVRAPAIEAQFIETFLLLTLNHQSLIATKTNRIVRAAGGARRRDSGRAGLLHCRVRRYCLHPGRRDLWCACRRYYGPLLGTDVPGRVYRIQDLLPAVSPLRHPAGGHLQRAEIRRAQRH